MDVNYIRKSHYVVGNANYSEEQLETFYQRPWLLAVRSEYWNIFRRISSLWRQLHHYHSGSLKITLVRKITVDVLQYFDGIVLSAVKNGNPDKIAFDRRRGCRDICTLFTWSHLINYEKDLDKIIVPNVFQFDTISKQAYVIGISVRHRAPYCRIVSLSDNNEKSLSESRHGKRSFKIKYDSRRIF